jgi:hypothetical protein
VKPSELAEREGKPIALAWCAAARATIERMDALAVAALSANYAWERANDSERALLLREVPRTFAAVERVLHDSSRRFASVSERAARRIYPSPPHADIPPAYAVYADRVFFTPRFEPWDAARERGFGPTCRAAMVLHEAVHIVDPRGGEPEVHVSEWDEPRFSSQTPEQALHNPSAYASFAAQAWFAKLAWPPSERPGAGNRER